MKKKSRKIFACWKTYYFTSVSRKWTLCQYFVFQCLKKIFFFSIRDNIHIGFRDNCGCPQVVVAPSIQSAAASEDSSRSPLHYHGTSKLYLPWITSKIWSKAEFSESTICNWSTAVLLFAIRNTIWYYLPTFIAH